MRRPLTSARRQDYLRQQTARIITQFFIEKMKERIALYAPDVIRERERRKKSLWTLIEIAAETTRKRS